MYSEHTFDYQNQFRFDSHGGVALTGFNDCLKNLILATKPRPPVPVTKYGDYVIKPVPEMPAAPFNGLFPPKITWPGKPDPNPTDFTFF